MYELQSAKANSNTWTNGGHRSGSIADLKDYATLQNTDYRIVDQNGKIVWQFSAKLSK